MAQKSEPSNKQLTDTSVTRTAIKSPTSGCLIILEDRWRDFSQEESLEYKRTEDAILTVCLSGKAKT